MRNLFILGALFGLLLGLAGCKADSKTQPDISAPELPPLDLPEIDVSQLEELFQSLEDGSFGIACDKTEEEMDLGQTPAENRLTLQTTIPRQQVAYLDCNGERTQGEVAPTRVHFDSMTIEPPQGLSQPVARIAILNQRTCHELEVAAVENPEPMEWIEDEAGNVTQQAKREILVGQDGRVYLGVNNLEVLLIESTLAIREGLNAITLQYFGQSNCVGGEEASSGCEAPLLANQNFVLDFQPEFIDLQGEREVNRCRPEPEAQTQE